MVKSSNTEQTILDAAITIFLQKGFDGARMQEIADRAGINKALLHYYFRSKEKLFAAVFENTIKQIGPALITFINEDIPLEVKIWKFVDHYIDLVKKFPNMPLFILNEINANPERIVRHLDFGEYVDFSKLEAQLRDQHEAGHIIKVDIRHFVVNLIGMTVFPFAGKPIIQKNLGIAPENWDQFIEERKKIIPETIMNWIRTKN